LFVPAGTVLAWRLGVPRHHGGGRGFWGFAGSAADPGAAQGACPPFSGIALGQAPDGHLPAGWLGFVLMETDRRLGFGGAPVSLQILGSGSCSVVCTRAGG
jgi:hypothetical protein